MLISVCNIKGGVGKTTTVLNLACVFAKNKKVLVYDMDKQKACGYFFECFEEKKIFPTKHKNIDIYINKKFKKIKGYDIILFDTPAGLNKASKEAIKHSNLTIVPVLPNIFSIRTFNEMVDMGFENLKILLNGVEKKSSHKKIIDLILKLPQNQYFKTYIPKNDIIETMGIERKCITQKAPASNISKAYEKIAKEIMNFSL
jgi:cellulose biosynthesis protein BcsQ